MKMLEKEKVRYIIVMIAFFLTWLILFKDILFFSEKDLVSTQINDDILISYNDADDRYIPVDENAAVYYSGYNTVANMVEINFEQGLNENISFLLYNVSNDAESNLIEQRTVRAGYKTIKFYFSPIQLEGIRIRLVSEDGSHYSEIPRGTISIRQRYINVLHGNFINYVIVLCILIVSGALTVIIYKCNCNDNKVKNPRNNRESNLELLRIICMVLLVAHHFAVHGGLLNLGFSLPKYIGLMFLPVGKICFIAFIAISMYFLVDGKNKSQRFLKCWLEVFFYSVLFTIVTWCMGGCVRFRDLISSFFVMISNSHGFAASYLLFLLLYPFILLATRNTTKKQARYLLLLLFWIQILSQIFRTWTGYTQPVFSELTLFIFCYMLSLNLKRYPLKVLDDKFFDIMLLSIVYIYVFVINLIAYKGHLNEVTSVLYGITGDESSIFFVVGGYLLFYLFKNIHIPNSRIINSVAACTFGVLLIHDHNFFRHLFWNEVVKVQIHFYSDKFILWFLMSVVGIFFVCSVIDYCRQKILEKNIVKQNWFNYLVSKMDEILEEKSQNSSN